MKSERDILLRSVIKEELVILTMHRDEAAILNQFLYWTPRTKTYDQFLSEESARMQQEVNEFEGGWIYKAAEELKNELLMIDTNLKTIRKYLKNLVDKGFLLRRNNPMWKVDRTYQYRVNLRKIIDDLNLIGHQLEGFEEFSLTVAETKHYYHYEKEKGHFVGANLTMSKSQKVLLNEPFSDPKVENKDVSIGNMSVTIPEITSNITNQKLLTENIHQSNVEDEKELIKFHYLYLSNAVAVSKEDERLIDQLLNVVGDPGYIYTLMDECYKLKITKEDAAGQQAAGIWSFKYFYNYIMKEFKAMWDSSTTTFSWEQF